jgi:hypothetical protein
MFGFKLQMARSNDHAVSVSEPGSTWGKMLARPVVKSVNTTPCGSTGRAVEVRLFVLGAIMSHPNSAMRNNLCH